MKDNCVAIDFDTKQTKCGDLNLPDEKLKASATILANILLDYMKSGGDMNDLTPSKVFGQRRKQ